MKRDRRLHGLSSDHHHALLLARELGQHPGPWTSADGAALLRRFEEELEPHFRVEEELMLPALRAADEVALVERTLADHAVLRALVRVGDEASARRFGERLHQHVRFEEEALFPACEARLSGEVLEAVALRAPKSLQR